MPLAGGDQIRDFDSAVQQTVIAVNVKMNKLFSLYHWIDRINEIE
jgi:hypothetical protein